MLTIKKFFYLSLLYIVSTNIYAHNEAIPEGYKLVQCKLVSMEQCQGQEKSFFAPKHIASDIAIAPVVPGTSSTSNTSTSWAGYAAYINQNPNNSVQIVSGSWYVPWLTQTSLSGSACTIWVGMDGFDSESSALELIGTAQDFGLVNGVLQQVNSAWYQINGVAQTFSGFSVNPGDFMSASITFSPNTPSANGQYRFVLLNNTQKTAVVAYYVFSSTTPATGTQASAEWIVSGTLPLANFGSVYFTDCWCNINGNYGPINNSLWSNQAIARVNSGNTALATPSPLYASGPGAYNNGQASGFIVMYNQAQ